MPKNEREEESSKSQHVLDSYALHPSDHPGLIFVPNQFGGDNFATWKSDMETALFAKGKARFINGKLVKPEESDDEFLLWLKNDSMVKAWIRNSLAKEIQDSLTYVDTTREIWVELCERYGQSNAPKLYKIRKEISNLTQEEEQIVTQYFTRFKTLWQEMETCSSLPLCTCDAAKEYKRLREIAKGHQFLLGLRGDFDRLRSQVLSMESTPTLSKIFSLALQEEQQICMGKVMSNLTIEGAAFAANSDYKGTGRGRGRGQQSTGDNRNTKKCDHCEKMRHTKEECFEIIGYPSNWRGNRTSSGQNFQQNRGGQNRFGQSNAANVDKRITNNIGSNWDEQKTGSNDMASKHAVVLSKEQFSKLLNMLDVGSSQNQPIGNEFVANFAGPSYEDADWTGKP